MRLTPALCGLFLLACDHTEVEHLTIEERTDQMCPSTASVVDKYSLLDAELLSTQPQSQVVCWYRMERIPEWTSDGEEGAEGADGGASEADAGETMAGADEIGREDVDSRDCSITKSPTSLGELRAALREQFLSGRAYALPREGQFDVACTLDGFFAYAVPLAGECPAPDAIDHYNLRIRPAALIETTSFDYLSCLYDGAHEHITGGGCSALRGFPGVAP